MSAERWKRIFIKGRPINYEVSDEGRVRHCYTKRVRRLQIIVGRHCAQLYIASDGRKRRTYRVAPLVARAFLPKRPSKHQIEHKDQNKLNDRATNLMWATQSENIRRSYQLTNRRRSKTPGLLSERSFDLIVGLIRTGKYSQLRIAAATGFSNSAISRIAAGSSANRTKFGQLEIEVDYEILNAPNRKPKLPVKYTDALIREVCLAKGQIPPAKAAERFGLTYGYLRALWYGQIKRSRRLCPELFAE